MLEMQNISFSYDRRPVLRGISLAFPAGKITAILGLNGCGKSTLLRVAVGLCRPQGGCVLLDDVPLSQLASNQVAQKITYLPQSRNIPDITARRMVLHGRFPYLSYPRQYRSIDYEIAEQALSWVNAGDLADQNLQTMSGGQRQKIYIATALAQQAQTVMLDEPTTYLDIHNQYEVLELSRRLADEGRAVVLVMHDIGLALQYVDSIVVMEDGCMLTRGTAEETAGAIERLFQVTLHRISTPEGIRYFCSP